MMDKVASISLLLPDASDGTCLGRIRAWDFVRLIGFADGLDGVYGPLYRLFEITDENFSKRR